MLDNFLGGALIVWYSNLTYCADIYVFKKIWNHWLNFIAHLHSWKEFQNLTLMQKILTDLIIPLSRELDVKYKLSNMNYKLYEKTQYINSITVQWSDFEGYFFE